MSREAFAYAFYPFQGAAPLTPERLAVACEATLLTYRPLRSSGLQFVEHRSVVTCCAREDERMPDGILIA
jgi:hypothetical protein